MRIEEALMNQRELLIDPLIAKGALQSGARLNQTKIDAAFRAAIIGGRLSLVQRIWEIGGDKHRPALTFNDVGDGGRHKRSPVTLLLFRRPRGGTPWEGLGIARWLAAQGCDLNAAAADGTTLLHIAADAGDVGFVRFLLNRGMSASTPGKYGLPALGGVESEDVAMALLEAGTDMSRMNDSGQSYRTFAEYNHWQRVVAWLTAHHQ
jgi:ankyrin repeat protein